MFVPAAAPVPGADLGRMLDAIAHRGPDGSGTWASEDRRYLAGFRRLAIIDLATGDQPLVDHGGRWVLVGNGEIYNYLELRANHPGRSWQSSGDMETVLPLADRDGDGFVDHLNGMFALALYDRSAHRLTLVRDRLGIKPLYWARTSSGAILFASEVKSLFASGLIAAEIDEAAVSSYLAHGWVPAPETLWRGISKLPPACRLTIESTGEAKLERYWECRPAANAPTDPEAARLMLTELLDDAVRLQLRSDVPVGALLSGGIDSGLLVALAARRLDRPLKTYTVRFEGAAVDESPLAAQVAQRYGTTHQVFDVAMSDVADQLPRLAWYCDEPLADASLLPNQLIEDLLGREIRVVLNGTGGDELFAGYGRHFRLPVESRYLRIPAPLRQALRSAVRPLAPMIAWRLDRAEKFDGDRAGYLHDHLTFFPPPIRRLIGCRLPFAAIAQAAPFAQFPGPADTAQLHAEIATYLPEDLLLLLDRTTMAASVEGRVPFLDHRLVEAALSLSPEVRTLGGRQKGLERAMAAPFLPPDILNAPKQGFASPVTAWLRGPLGGLLRRLLTSPAALARGWWTGPGIDSLFAQVDRHGHRIYALSMLELLVRIHVEGAPHDQGLEAVLP